MHMQSVEKKRSEYHNNKETLKGCPSTPISTTQFKVNVFNNYVVKLSYIPRT